MRWRARPLRCLRRRLMRAVGLQPAPRQHPARVPDHGGPKFGRLPARGTCQHLLQAFATTRAVMQEIGHPGVDLFARDVRPGQAVPGAEIGFQQGVVNHVSPAQAAQVPPHGVTAFQRRRAHQAGQPMFERMPVDAARQSPGLARVDAQVGAANAATGVRTGTWVAPGDEAMGLRPRGGVVQHIGLKQPDARPGAKPAGWPARPVAGWRPGCRP